jgi:heptosyltransferase III
MSDDLHPPSAVLVVRAGALGDTLLTLPAICALRQRFPAARIEAVGAPAAWAALGPVVDRIHDADDPAAAPLLSTRPLLILPAPVAGAELIVLWSSRTPSTIEAPVRAIAASPYPPPGVHAAPWLLSTLRPLGITQVLDDLVPPRAAPLALSPDELATGRAVLDGLGLDRPILIHPGAGAVWKRWPPDRFAHVARRLRDAGRPVALLAGPADRAAVDAVLARIDLPVLENLPPRTLAAVLSHAALYIGNDSGVTHLAALVGAPTLALFGPTDPASWSPLGRVRIIRRCTAVPSAAGEIRVCHDPACLEAIDTETVLAAAGELLG